MMEWTTEHPKVRGWYWALEDLDAVDRDIFCVFVPAWEDGICFALEARFSFYHFSHFTGPLSLPALPEEAGV